MEIFLCTIRCSTTFGRPYRIENRGLGSKSTADITTMKRIRDFRPSRACMQAAGNLHVTCVTLGSPLVGDKNFAEAFRALQYHKNGREDADRSPQTLDCTRIVHAMDPVPMVPPAPWGCVPALSELKIENSCPEI